MSYVVGVAAIYMKYHNDIHWKASKRTLHYVEGTKHFGIHYVASSPLEIVGFTDWDGGSIERNYTLGYVFMLVPYCFQEINNTPSPFIHLSPSTEEH